MNTSPEIIGHQHVLLRAALRFSLAEQELSDEKASFIRLEAEGEALLDAARALVRAADGDGPLTFAELQATNEERCKRWHTNFLDPNDAWNVADWANAMTGEAGELAGAVITLVLAMGLFQHAGLAGNTVKKVRRIETGAVSNVSERDRRGLETKALKELGDVVIYADLLARKLNSTLAGAVTRAFNEVSNRHGFPEKLRRIPRVDAEATPEPTYAMTLNQSNEPRLTAF